MYIKVRVIAGAKKEVIEKVSDDTFMIAVKEPAERNLANKRIIQIIEQQFSLNKGAVRIISGHHSPSKIFSIRD